jgi:hypothetical protein
MAGIRLVIDANHLYVSYPSFAVKFDLVDSPPSLDVKKEFGRILQYAAKKAINIIRLSNYEDTITDETMRLNLFPLYCEIDEKTKKITVFLAYPVGYNKTIHGMNLSYVLSYPEIEKGVRVTRPTSAVIHDAVVDSTLQTATTIANAGQGALDTAGQAAQDAVRLSAQTFGEGLKAAASATPWPLWVIGLIVAGVYGIITFGAYKKSAEEIL